MSLKKPHTRALDSPIVHSGHWRNTLWRNDEWKQSKQSSEVKHILENEETLMKGTITKIKEIKTGIGCSKWIIEIDYKYQFEYHCSPVGISEGDLVYCKPLRVSARGREVIAQNSLQKINSIQPKKVNKNSWPESDDDILRNLCRRKEFLNAKGKTCSKTSKLIYENQDQYFSRYRSWQAIDSRLRYLMGRKIIKVEKKIHDLKPKRIKREYSGYKSKYISKSEFKKIDKKEMYEFFTMNFSNKDIATYYHTHANAIALERKKWKAIKDYMPIISENDLLRKENEALRNELDLRLEKEEEQKQIKNKVFQYPNRRIVGLNDTIYEEK